MVKVTPMNFQHNYIFFLLLLFGFTLIFIPDLVYSQKDTTYKSETYKTIGLPELRSKEQHLISIGDSILKGSSDSLRLISSNIFYDEMKSLLSYQNTFSFVFDSLTSISVLKSKDGLIKMYTWILPAVDRNKYSYFGFIQILNKKTKQVELVELHEKKYDNEETIYKTLPANEWYGALYYKMIEKKIKGKTCYTLLGWHGNNNKTTRKIIDVLTFKDQLPQFGMPLFKTGKRPVSRIIFEFTSQAVMKLNVDDRKKMIVFDHLSPAAGAQPNQFEFYGPDFRYDGLQFKKGYWQLKKDIDLRNPRSYDAKEGKKEKGKSMYKSGE